MRHGTVAGAVAGLLMVAGAANADILHFDAVLKGANVTPPNSARGHGEVVAMLDTDRRTLDYTVTFSRLSGPATTAAFKDKAAQAATIAAPALGKGSEVHAAVTLTDAQIADLKAGRWSFSISTQANPGGEIGGVLRRTSGAY